MAVGSLLACGCCCCCCCCCWVMVCRENPRGLIGVNKMIHMQHIPHGSLRASYEQVTHGRHGGRQTRILTGAKVPAHIPVSAAGQLQFSHMYTAAPPPCREPKPWPEYIVERRTSQGVWVTAARASQCQGVLEYMRNIAASSPSYRLCRLENGAYRPV